MTNRTIFVFLTTALVFLVLSTNPCFSLEMKTFDDLLYMEPEKTISLDFTDANLNDVLKIFSQQSGLNFIAATDVASKKVNLYLDEVPVKEALERILSANNLTYELKPESNIFVVNELKVSSKHLIMRVYPLKFATVPSSKLNKTLSIKTEEDDEDVDVDLKSMGILGAISSILTENGSVIEDPRTNSLIVSDIPSQFSLIEQTIARLDVRVPQILIEAELLDISKNTADLLGAKFGNTPMTFSGGERDHVYPWNQNQLLNKGYNFEEAEYRVGTISFAGLAVTLQFLRTMTDTKNLARPRILTLNNDTAEISISTNEAIGLASSTTSSEGTSTSVAEAERVQTGVFLKVTPQANIHTREITMAIEPKVIQAKQGGTFGSGGGEQSFKDPEERGSKSILRVRDGDTIVLGGLLRTNTDQIRTHVPILGNIPLFGSAFRHKNKSESQRELIIFITPHIIIGDTTRVVSSNQNITREQSGPMQRRKTIEKELSSFEDRKFNSY